MLKQRIRARIKREMGDGKPTVWIGKSGVTDQSLKETLKQLERSGIIKMRILKSALKDEGAQSIIQKVVRETDSMLIDQRGHVFVIYKPKKRKKPL